MYHDAKTFSPLPLFVNVLARLSGRDAGILARCPASERAQTTARGLALLACMGLFTVAAAAALHVLGTGWAVAVPLALLIGTAVLGLDITILHASDLDVAETTARRGGAAHGPRLGAREGRIGRGVMRSVFTLAVTPALALFVGLHFYDADLRNGIEAAQHRRDADIRAQAVRRIGAERAPVAADHAAAAAALRSYTAQHRAALDAHGARIMAARSRVAALEAERADLGPKAAAARETERAQREIARCEIAGVAPGCGDIASGIPTEGPFYRLAIERADAAKDDAERAEARLTALAGEVSAANRALRAAMEASPPAPSHAGAEARAWLGDATEALAAFDRRAGARVEALVAAHPDRIVERPESLTARIGMLLAMLREGPAFAAVFALVALFALAIDLLPLMMATAIRPATYHLLLGQRLAEEARACARSCDIADIDDAEQRDRAARLRRRQNAAARNSPRFREVNDDIELEHLKRCRDVMREANARHGRAA